MDIKILHELPVTVTCDSSYNTPYIYQISTYELGKTILSTTDHILLTGNSNNFSTILTNSIKNNKNDTLTLFKCILDNYTVKNNIIALRISDILYEEFNDIEKIISKHGFEKSPTLVDSAYLFEKHLTTN